MNEAGEVLCYYLKFIRVTGAKGSSVHVTRVSPQRAVYTNNGILLTLVKLLAARQRDKYG